MSIEDRLRQAMTSGPQPEAGEEAWGRIVRRAGARRRPWARRLAVLLPVLGLAGAGLELSGALSPAGRPAQVRVVPGPTPGVGAGNWAQEWSAPSSQSWPHGGPPNYLAFGPATTLSCSPEPNPSCFVVVQTNGMEPSPTGSSPSVPSALYRGAEGASRWSPVSLPARTWLSSPLTCSGSQECAVGAVINGVPGATPGESGQPVMLTTTDAGGHWTRRPMPAGVGLVPSLACSSPLRCVALTWGRQGTNVDGLGPQSGADRFFETSVVTTTNGGRTWRSARLPDATGATHYQLDSVVCPTGQDCIARGEREKLVDQSGSYVPASATSVVLSSRDGGSTWSYALTSSAVSYNALACGTPSDCLLIAQNEPPLANAAAQILVSNNGGRTWVSEGSGGLPDLFASPPIAVSCESAQRCLAVASGFLARTSDGGVIWTVFEPSPLPSPPYGGVTMTSVACIQLGSCLALEDMSVPPAMNGVRNPDIDPAARVLVTPSPG